MAKFDKVVNVVRENFVPEFQAQKYDEAPWAELTKPVNQAKGVLISTGGVYLSGTTPFTDHYGLGDPSYREIPLGTANDKLQHYHEHYDHTNANEDVNCIFPLERLSEMVEEEEIGSLSDYHYSFMGYIPIPHPLITRTAPDVANKLKLQDVDFAFIAPG
ncbi:glycine/sarcosine/betaine reductase selenoprotein B family protein [Halobacillus amylolyticus]|uniref:Glycine/betaine/sarcosine/D-proline family reductase selenoprotein B n=1 Tax=Halobacillus amylolyticus TaxID=2932259 RepID=A0ABY4H8M9_9BACI|nr:glycine/sarcosine/betaine reductase selenoprotein B family protein [Halobacillus amylolyticus]UOR10827.1 glycine/betaine/sarcosine/D-proline family reductase selenoprotein B [Halobacillus amylolyticus]